MEERGRGRKVRALETSGKCALKRGWRGAKQAVGGSGRDPEKRSAEIWPLAAAWPLVGAWLGKVLGGGGGGRVT